MTGIVELIRCAPIQDQCLEYSVLAESIENQEDACKPNCGIDEAVQGDTSSQWVSHFSQVMMDIKLLIDSKKTNWHRELSKSCRWPAEGIFVSLEHYQNKGVLLLLSLLLCCILRVASPPVVNALERINQQEEIKNLQKGGKGEQYEQGKVINCLALLTPLLIMFWCMDVACVESVSQFIYSVLVESMGGQKNASKLSSGAWVTVYYASHSVMDMNLQVHPWMPTWFILQYVEVLHYMMIDEWGHMLLFAWRALLTAASCHFTLQCVIGLTNNSRQHAFGNTLSPDNNVLRHRDLSRSHRWPAKDIHMFSSHGHYSVYSRLLLLLVILLYSVLCEGLDRRRPRPSLSTASVEEHDELTSLGNTDIDMGLIDPPVEAVGKGVELLANQLDVKSIEESADKPKKVERS
eukprot:Gb_18162 [translate_table: standard]